MEEKNKLDWIGKSFKNKVVKYYGCKIKTGGTPWRGAYIIVQNHGREWVCHTHDNLKLKKELQSIGFEGSGELSKMSREERDTRLKKVVSLITYDKRFRMKEKRDPIDVEYYYKDLEERKDKDLEKEAEENIKEWIKEWEEREFSDIVEKNKVKVKKGESLRGVKNGNFKTDLQALIGYCLFWEEEDYEEIVGTIDIEFKDQLEKGAFNIDLLKALKDIGEIYREHREELEIGKVRNGRWELSAEKKVGDKEKKRRLVEEENDVLQIYKPVKVNKRSIDKKVTIRCDSEELDFLKDFDGWSENGVWKENDEITVVINFADYKDGNIEKMLYRCFRLYSLRFLENKLKFEFEGGN